MAQKGWKQLEVQNYLNKARIKYEINPIRKANGMKILEPKMRTCLGSDCDTVFESRNANHRLCAGCENKRSPFD